MRDDYAHTQVGWLFLAVTGAMAVGFGWSVVREGRPGSALGLAAAVVCGVLFCTLTIRLERDRLVWRFGPGLVRRSVPLAEVEEVRPVRNSPLWGWGLRHFPGGGRLYNVSGTGAVEVRLRSGRRFRLGTDEPEALARALEARLPPRPAG
ncbi:MAG TPA: hypothetical protein VHG91_14390 [Longimicrobium sp.]|nr:hypothetical protein [Longimicrobium sp.]